MRAIWLSLCVLAVAGCRPSGMRAYSVQSIENGGISAESPADPLNSSEDNADSSSSPSPRSAKPGNSASTDSDGRSPSPSPFSPTNTTKPLPPVASQPPPEEDSEVAPGEKPPLREDPVFPVGKNSPRPIDARKDADAPALPTPETNSKDFLKQGNLIPTIYYQPLLIDNDELCSPNERETMFGAKGVALLKVCPQTLQKCSMEGSCRVSQNGVVRSFNVLGGNAGFHTFFEVGKDDCFFGFGVNSICLDPFYTVAADLRYYRAGDVIYVPALVGGTLPNGEKHSGFLVVRDKGGGIHGPNRFDFFSGSLTWQDPENPFGQIKLSDKNTRVLYFKVTGESAKKVLARRGYPRMPMTL